MLAAGVHDRSVQFLNCVPDTVTRQGWEHCLDVELKELDFWVPQCACGLSFLYPLVPIAYPGQDVLAVQHFKTMYRSLGFNHEQLEASANNSAVRAQWVFVVGEHNADSYI